MGGLTETQQRVFRNAGEFWSSVIAADVPGVRIDGERIDDLLIEAVGTQIDGESGILGQAGPTYLRNSSLIPAKGSMEFDRSDLARMEGEGSLQSVIIHWGASPYSGTNSWPVSSIQEPTLSAG